MPGSGLVQSVVRATRIMQEIGQSSEGRRLSELSESLELGTTTVHNLVRTLAARGFVDKRSGRYVIGPAFWQLAESEDRHRFLAAVDRTLLSFHAVFPDTTLTVSELCGNRIAVIRRVSPDIPGLVQRPVQRFFNLYANASGLAVLAFAEEEVGIAFCEAWPFYEEGMHLWNSLERLDAFLDDTRRRGVAVLPFPEAYFRAAAPIRTGGGSLRAVLGVSRPEPDEESEGECASLTDALLAHARQLSEHSNQGDRA